MKKILTILPLVALSSTSFITLAKSPNWNFIEGSYMSAEIEDTEIEPDGFGISGSFLVGENIILGASYGSISEEIFNTDVDLNQGSAHLGYRYGATESTDIFGTVSYQYIELEAESESFDENGYGLHAGVRSMLTDSFEVVAQVNYIDIDGESETGLGASAYYHFSDNFAIGAGYATADDVDTFTASLRLSF